jgi:hypothetical protein
VYFQPKAWADRAFCNQWAEDQLKDISDEHHKKADGTREDLLLFLDNLDAQVQEPFKRACLHNARASVHFYPANYTDHLAPPDAGFGAQLKHWFGVYLDAWLWHKNNIDHWESGKFPASERRVLVTHILSRAWKKVIAEANSDSLLRYFTKTGCAVTANGEDDELICPQPFEKGEFKLDTVPDAAAQVQPPLNTAGTEEEPEEPDDDMEDDLYDGILDAFAAQPGSARITLDEGEGEEVGGALDEDDAYCLFEALSAGREGGTYQYVPLPEGGAKDVQNGDIIVKLFTTGWERGKVEDMKKASPKQKREAKDFTVPRLVRYVLDSSYWLHDLGNENATYLSAEQFKNLDEANAGEAGEGVEVGAWCIVSHVPSEMDDDEEESGDGGSESDEGGE